MIHVLLVSREKSIFSELEAAFSENNIILEWTDTAQNAILKLSKENFDLFITDENLPDMTGKKFIESVLFKNPMINCVALSALSHEAFHEAHEGLGVLMQFPLTPGKKQAKNLLDHLNRIHQITNQAKSFKGGPDDYQYRKR